MKHTTQQITIQPALLPDQQYTCVTTISNKVYARARARDGSPLFIEQQYSPTYYTETHPLKATTHSFDGKPLSGRTFSTLYEGREWMKGARLPVYGDIQPEYMMLGDAYGARDVNWDYDRLYIWFIDIEVDSEHGFAKPEDPYAEVTAITVTWQHMGKSGTVVYGRKDYVVKGDELYLHCQTEEELLLRFLDDFKSAGDYPDIITGWNIQFYDIPYLVKRMQRLFTEDTWETISPFNRLADRKLFIQHREQLVIDIKGIAILDYFEMYRKFILVQQESYRLDHIAHVELKERKLSYSEYHSLRKLYRDNHQLFIEYNIQDVSLVVRLDGKLKLLELVLALAYGAKCNFSDCFKQVRLWDIMIYHKLRNDNKQIPPRPNSVKGDQYAGAYVKDSVPGLYRWVCSFDVASMYPHIIREWNLSPETKLPGMVHGLTELGEDGKKRPKQELIDQQIDTNPIKAKDVCLASNGVMTDRYREGFLPEMLKTLYDERIRFKKLQKAAEKEKENCTDPVRIAQLTKDISAFENQQKTRKVNLNSAYGAMGSAFFRFYDIDLAEAVTVTGQMVIRWVANDINRYLNTIFKTEVDYIIASDTDSVYINMERVASLIGTEDKGKIVSALDNFCQKKIQPLIDKAFVDIADYLHVATPCMSMVRDVIADNGIWLAKKHYVLNVYDAEGNRYKAPKLLMHGIATVKSDTPTIARNMMKQGLTMMVSGATQEDMWTYLKQCEKDFRAAPLEDIAKPSSVNGLEEYAGIPKGTPQHVRGALVFNERLEREGLTQFYEPIMSGEKIKTIALRMPNPFHSHVLGMSAGCPPEWEIDKWIDHDTQFDKVFMKPFTDIIKVAGWSTVRESSVFD